MKIAIDISQLVYGTGVSTYTKNLVKNLLKIDKENDYVLFGGSLRRKHELKDYIHSLEEATFKSKIFPISPSLADFFGNRVRIFPVESLIGKVDVFHSSDWSQPKSSAFKVTTVHDLVPIKFPEQSHPKIIAVHKRRLEIVKKEIDKIIVPSHTTKKDLMETGFRSERIVVIPEAVDPLFKQATKKEVEAVKKKYEIMGGYIFSVGMTPRKNSQRIIDAFLLLKEKNKDLELIFIGRPQNGFNIVEGVRVLGHVPSEDRPALYSGAEALVYPSLYEGFGLPILEAFECGIPVVTSNLGSMKEVAGNAAILVDPENVEEIAEGVENAIRSANLLTKKALKRSRLFSWEKTAAETLEIYKNR